MSDLQQGPDQFQIDIVSDVMCPWCYIGKRRIEKALALCADLPVRVHWRPYQLDPTLPPEGLDRRTYLEKKFGGPEGARQIYDRIREAGASEGIDFDFEAINVSPNTIDAHRLIRWAANIGAQDAVVEALFAAYFLNGRNIGDHDVLVAIAGEAGMDTAIVRDLLASDADRDLVEREIELARSMGINGVPCFILANQYAVSGAQNPQVLAQAIRQAAAGKAG